METELNNTYKSIVNWAKEDRPREKLERLGPSALSNAELLGILIGSGTQKESAVDLMKRILIDCNNNLNTLGKLSIRELEQYKGVGPAKAISILAACELGKRRAMEKAQERTSIDSSKAIYEYLHPRMQDLDVEEAWIMLLNQHYKLIKAMAISHGGITETAVCNATVLVLAHNHPSNHIQPSKSDDQLTQRVKKACEAVRIHFLDHVIVTDGTYYSYHDSGRL